ncbi:MAG: B12-binding domain-containing radical SAM protein, partial [Candidatus Helarchaeales archaeon]
MHEIDFLMIIPPPRPLLRPLDLTFPFFEKINKAEKLEILPLQEGPLRIMTILKNEGHEVAFHDFCHFSGAATLEETVRNLVKKYNPRVVGGYSYTAYMRGLKKIFKLFKQNNPNITTVAGGPHVTFLDDESLREFNGALDVVVRGEGEKTIVELMSSLNRGKNLKDVKGITFKNGSSIKRNPDQMLLSEEELSNLPLLDFSVIPVNQLGKLVYFAMSISRGCPYNCSFCQNPRFWKRKLRFRQVSKVIEELKILNDKFQVWMDFGDTNLPINLKVYEELVREYLKEQLQNIKIEMVLVRSDLCDERRLNLTQKLIKDQPYAYVTVGIENAHESVLQIMNKPSWKVQSDALRKIKARN